MTTFRPVGVLQQDGSIFRNLQYCLVSQKKRKNFFGQLYVSEYSPKTKGKTTLQTASLGKIREKLSDRGVKDADMDINSDIFF